MSLVIAETPRPGVRQLTLNRPEARNALSTALIEELAAQVTVAVKDDAIGCVVITGSRTVFSAGADIKEMLAGGIAVLEQPKRCAAWAVIEDCPKPLIAAVRGYAFGGGNELAMLADFIIASPEARFGQPEINLGILPGDGGTQRLPRLAGKALATLMIMSGEPIDAPTALRAGLVAEIAPPGQTLERALDLAERIAARAPVAQRLIKQAIRAADEAPLSEGLKAERRARRRDRCRRSIAVRRNCRAPRRARSPGRPAPG